MAEGERRAAIEHYRGLLDRELEHQGVLRANGKRRIVVTRSYPSHRYKLKRSDLIKGLTLLCEAIAAEGIIVADSPAWTQWHFFQREHEDPWTEISVYELCEAHKPKSSAVDYQRRRTT